jgi:biotin carboxyl carrier protein
MGPVRRGARVHRDGPTVYVDSVLGSTTLHEVERFPVAEAVAPEGSLLAALPGAVVRIAVEVGEEIAAGDVLVVLEAMKMEHRVLASADGTVTELRVVQGQQVDSGDVLAVVDDDPLAGSSVDTDDPLAGSSMNGA